MRGMCWLVAALAAVFICWPGPARAEEPTDWGTVFERARRRAEQFDWSRFEQRRDAPQDAPRDTQEAARPDVPQPGVARPEAAQAAPSARPPAAPAMTHLPVIPVPNPPLAPETAPEPEPVPEKRYRIDFPGVEARKPAPEPAPEPAPAPVIEKDAAVPEAAPVAVVREPAKPAPPLLTPEQEARARAEALRQPEPTIDPRSIDPKAWREAVAAKEARQGPLLTPEEEARARAEALAEPQPSIDVATLDPKAWREAVAPKPLYGPAQVEHFMDLALYDAASQTARLDGGPEPGSGLLARRSGEVRLRVLGKVPPEELARVEAVLRGLAPALARLSGLGVRLVPASDRTANANVFVMAASPGDALEGYTKLGLDERQAIARSDTVLYQGASDAAVRREALRAMGLTGRDMAERDSIMRPMPRGHGLPEPDAAALAMLYRPELRPGMDYAEVQAVLEALRK